MSNIFKLCPTHFPGECEKIVGGIRPSWLGAWGKVVTSKTPTGLEQLRGSLLCPQRQVVKLASGLLYSWSLLRNNNTAINLQMFISSDGSRRFATSDQGSH